MPSLVSQSFRIGLIAAGLALGAVPALAQSKPAPQVKAETAMSSPIIAKGNGFTVKETDLEQFALTIGADAESLKDPQKRPMLIDYMLSFKALALAAQTAKVDQSAVFTQKLADLKQQVLVQTYLDQEIKKAITPEALRKGYDEATQKMQPTPEVRARHILVETEDQAKAASARIKAGEDFAKVAAEVSKDPGSKENGGELGFFAKDRMIAPFAEAAFKLDVNQVSDPVKTDFGWHVIQVEEKRTRPVPTMDELKPKLEEILTAHAQQAIVDKAKKAANVQLLEAPAAAPATK